jgi:hypothetical protein
MKDFNVLTFNSKAFPATAPLVVGRRAGADPPRQPRADGPPPDPPARLAFQVVTATDGGEVPESRSWPDTTSWCRSAAPA